MKKWAAIQSDMIEIVSVSSIAQYVQITLEKK